MRWIIFVQPGFPIFAKPLPSLFLAIAGTICSKFINRKIYYSRKFQNRHFYMNKIKLQLLLFNNIWGRS